MAPQPHPFWMRGHRLRIYGELSWLRKLGVLDVLAVTSESRANYLRRAGFRPIVVPLGYHQASYGTDLGLGRDIEVGFLGNLEASRRRRLLDRISRGLASQGLQISVQSDLYGKHRTHWLNRTRILLNILRASQDFVGQRFLLGAANKALVVSEPFPDHGPFVPGQHLVVEPPERIVDAIAFYAAEESRRRAIVERAYLFVTQDLAIERMVARIIEQAWEVRLNRGLAQPATALGLASVQP
jgi:hypothetical protein